MILLYSKPTCTSCIKAKSWLSAHNIPFEERNYYVEPLIANELIQILDLTEKGAEDVIAVRSFVFKKINLNLDELRLEELLDLLQKYPDLLRRPIIVDNKKLQIGYNEDDIQQFLYVV